MNSTRRERDLVRRYGLTLDAYRELLQKQNGRCAICGTTACVSGRGLAVDHCHETGRVRGILCSLCNAGLAKFRDDKLRLLRAVAYLQGSHDHRNL